MSDAKAIRRYQAGVDRALGLFDASNEWADYIAFLSRLLKALQASPSGAEVPSKSTLAKYLAQCLRPSLPAGVHQKALEAYGVIFTLLGQDGLASGLPRFFPGFAHTLSFASLGTRPYFLSLFDEHILKLPSRSLRPAIKAILLSLLPGIEEEGSEDFEKTLTTINRIRTIFMHDNIEDVFWQTLFLACVTSVDRRMGILIYLLRYLPKLGPGAQSGVQQKLDRSASVPIPVITTPEPGLLIRCFATGLQDEQPLVQRSFLDLLVTHFPLSSPIIQETASASDVDIIMSAALSIVLKRDMGLNRRLWAWFFGTDEKNATPATTRKASSTTTNGDVSIVEENNARISLASTYFNEFGLSYVVQTFRGMILRKPTVPSQRSRPFRILVSLMDRAPIGVPVVDSIFQALIADLREYQTLAPSQAAFDEVFRSATVFFDSVDPHLIAGHLLNLFKTAQLDLLEFIIGNFGLDDDDLMIEHISMIVSVMSYDLVERLIDSSDQLDSGQDTDRVEAIARVVDLLITFLPNQTAAFRCDISVKQNRETWSHQTSQIYQTASSDKTVSPSMVAEADLRSLQNVVLAVLGTLRSRLDSGLLDHLAVSFDKLCARAGSKGGGIIRVTGLLHGIADWSASVTAVDRSTFNISRNLVAMLASIISYTVIAEPLRNAYALDIVPHLVQKLWSNLAPASPQLHVESVDLIWTLRSLTADLLVVDSTILSLLSDSQRELHWEGDRDSAVNHFAVFWIHSAFMQTAHTSLPDGSENGGKPQVRWFFDRAALYAIDAASRQGPESPYKTWLANLSSLSYQYGVVLNPARAKEVMPLELATCLTRLKTLVSLSKGSPQLWKEFTDSSGSCQFVLKTTMMVMEDGQQRESLSLDALSIIRTIHEGSSYRAEEKLLKPLANHLINANSDSLLQTAILDTLQSLMPLQKGQDPPVSLLDILSRGILSPAVDKTIDKWITLLCNVLPQYADPVFFSNLLKLTDCFCGRIQQYFEVIKHVYQPEKELQTGRETDIKPKAVNPERSITNLLAGLEYILARAHTQVSEAVQPASARGSAAADASQRRSLANNRLTVVLCMQDAIKTCGQIWYWRLSKGGATPVDTKSFAYLSSRLRARSRRMLEHLADAEPQECLETLMGMWVDAVKLNTHPQSVMSLLQTLETARPKFMMPAIFNAIYNRTNPHALDQSQQSTLSVPLTGLELLAFLIDYVEALEDDLLEEIWSDCASFLRDILANPMPHRQLLLRLIEFTSTLCQKMERTTYGEQAKMRKEFSDLCTRLFAGVFTIKPNGFDASTENPTQPAKLANRSAAVVMQRFTSSDGIGLYCQVLPVMSPILAEGDRFSSIFSGISTHIIGPLIKARAFPHNITKDVISLLMIMSKTSSTTKIWRKDVLDAFNSQNFFQNPALSGEQGWLPVVRQLGNVDKSLLADLLGRLTTPTTAGIVFGVGAAAVRAEADKQTKANLRRIALVLLASETDTFATVLAQLIASLDELTAATLSSSPSSATRGEIYLVLRAICLSFTALNLVAIWPTVDSELRVLFEDIHKFSDGLLSTYSHLEGAKLLDLLLLLKPEEFQLHEWLFITDTIDAIYPPTNVQPVASADLLRLDDVQPLELSSSTRQGLRKPWLCTDNSRRSEEQSRLLGSYFSHLSIRSFEDTYSLEGVDMEACRKDILLDIFNEGDQT